MGFVRLVARFACVLCGVRHKYRAHIYPAFDLRPILVSSTFRLPSLVFPLNGGRRSAPPSFSPRMFMVYDINYGVNMIDGAHVARRKFGCKQRIRLAFIRPYRLVFDSFIFVL